MRFRPPWRFAATCILLTITACSQENGVADFSYEERIGMFMFREDNSCLTIHNPSLKPGMKLTLVAQPDDTDLDHEAPVIAAGTIAARQTDVCDDKMGNGDRETSPSFYRVLVPDQGELGRTAFAGLFVAVVEPLTPITLRDGKIDADLDGDGTKEFFRTCTSSEGGHFQIWTGLPLEGKPRWHWYRYAGYDTEYTCTDRDYFGKF